MTQIQLQPCPYCDHIVIEPPQLKGGDWFYVECQQCSARGPEHNEFEKEDAIHEWNYLSIIKQKSRDERYGFNQPYKWDKILVILMILTTLLTLLMIFLIQS